MSENKLHAADLEEQKGENRGQQRQMNAHAEAFSAAGRTDERHC